MLTTRFFGKTWKLTERKREEGTGRGERDRQNRIEWSGMEQNRIEQNGMEWNGMEWNRIEQNRIEQNRNKRQSSGMKS